MTNPRRLDLGRPVLALTVLALGHGALGCAESETTAADVMREAKEAAATAGQFVKEQVLAYRQAMSTKLEQLQPRMEALKSRAAALAAQGKTELAEKLEQLEAQRAVLKQKLAEASAASGEAWTDVKAGLDQAWTDLDLAIEQAMTRFAPDQVETPEIPTTPAEADATPASDTPEPPAATDESTPPAEGEGATATEDPPGNDGDG